MDLVDAPPPAPVRRPRGAPRPVVSHISDDELLGLLGAAAAQLPPPGQENAAPPPKAAVLSVPPPKRVAAGGAKNGAARPSLEPVAPPSVASLAALVNPSRNTGMPAPRTPVDLATHDPSFTSLKAYADPRALLDTLAEAKQRANRTPEEREHARAEAQKKVDHVKEMLHADTDPLKLYRVFYGIGEMADKFLKHLPVLQKQPPRDPEKIPLVSRSLLNERMLCWVEGQGPRVQQCCEGTQCVLIYLCKTMGHIETSKKNRAYSPGRAFYLPEEEAAGCTQPRQCYYCTVFMVNVLYEYFLKKGESPFVLNPWRVACCPGEFPPGSVLESPDTVSGIVGFFPYANTAQYVAVEAASPKEPYGFVLGTPVF